MKFIYFWKTELNKEEIKIHSHPSNEPYLKKMEKSYKQQQQIATIDPSNNRKVFLNMNEIERIESFGHLCRVFTDNNKEYLIQKRLKAMVELKLPNFHQINNASILNLSKIKSFSTGGHSRIEVHTYSKSCYIVSRHYAKKIKEILQ